MVSEVLSLSRPLSPLRLPPPPLFGGTRLGAPASRRPACSAQTATTGRWLGVSLASSFCVDVPHEPWDLAAPWALGGGEVGHSPVVREGAETLFLDRAGCRREVARVEEPLGDRPRGCTGCTRQVDSLVPHPLLRGSRSSRRSPGFFICRTRTDCDPTWSWESGTLSRRSLPRLGMGTLRRRRPGITHISNPGPNPWHLSSIFYSGLLNQSTLFSFKMYLF